MQHPGAVILLMSLMRGACSGGQAGGQGPIAQLAASRFFSMALGANGQVHGFGAGYNGELGPELAWSTSPKPIGPLQQVLPQAG